ncbi:MAG TPA: ABC transporter ATP-binding protein [Anaerolineaceae bacterium]|nr:ABC transporter ATP-binding protein [Anaerolineaceae bacterium]
MTDFMLRVENLGKRYFIGRKEKYRTFRESLTQTLSAPFRRSMQVLRGQSQQAAGLDQALWALKGVDFEIHQGDVVGVIGRNGAGKSTLLKILARITEPTTGRVRIRGRVGSLLEVGTGFHPELTGRENIFLNGAILGMHRAEIERKFDEIVAFAETEEFLDTPVKHYSSGMYVRLAFAVAAHLEPEILLVDEVLAVGDVAFQKKCLGKMGDVARTGRTVLFVSHNMAAISSLCSRGFLLERGQLVAAGEVAAVIDRYMETSLRASQAPLSQRADRQGDGRLRFTAVSFLNGGGQPTETGVSGQPLTALLRYETADGRPARNVDMDLAFYGALGQLLFFCKAQLARGNFESLPPAGVVACRIPKFPLPPGRYPYKLWCQVNRVTADKVEDAGVLAVEAGDFFGSGFLPTKNPEGIVMVEHDWELVDPTRWPLPLTVDGLAGTR